MTEIYQNNAGNRSDDYLDMEYLTTLRNIKPYITCIMNNHYIELIRVWLEKLSDIHTQHDKSLRNMYLVELGKQIVSGIFAEPFIDPPGEGSLPPFKHSWKFTKDKNISPQENTDRWTQSVSNNVSTQVIMDSTKCSSQSISEDTIKNGRARQSYAVKQENDSPSPKSQLHDVKAKLALVREYSKQICRKNAKKKKSKSKKQINIHTVSQRKMSDDTDVYPERYGGGRVEVPYREVRVYSPLRKLKHCDRKFNETDDSSWFDLTDCSTTATPAFCSGDGEVNGRIYNQEDVVQLQDIYEKKIAELVTIISDLKEENCNLASHVEKCEIELRNAMASNSLGSLTHEVESLKSQLQDLINIKLNLQNSHVGISSEWQSTVSTLHKKMAVLQRKSNELKLENGDLLKKLEEQAAERRKELNEQKKKMSELHNRETDMLKQIHARSVTDIEAKYTQKMLEQDVENQKRLSEIKSNYENRFDNLKEDYDCRIRTIKGDYDARLNKIGHDYEKALSSKNSEVARLERMLQEQCVKYVQNKPAETKLAATRQTLRETSSQHELILMRRINTSLVQKRFTNTSIPVHGSFYRMQEEVHLIRAQIESSALSNSETYMEKIAFLQKCILKMEKLYQKAEKDNLKQMTKLKRELEFRDKSNQVALTTQRADLLSITVNGKQNEIDLAVSQLEEYYRNKLIEHQQKALEEKRQDNKRIAELRDQVAKLSSEY